MFSFSTQHSWMLTVNSLYANKQIHYYLPYITLSGTKLSTPNYLLHSPSLSSTTIFTLLFSLWVPNAQTVTISQSDLEKLESQCQLPAFHRQGSHTVMSLKHQLSGKHSQNP